MSASRIIDADIIAIAQFYKIAASDNIAEREGVTTEQVDVLEAKRRRAGDVFWANILAVSPKALELDVHIDRVPYPRASNLSGTGFIGYR